MFVQVYGDNAMKNTAVYQWVNRFSVGKESATEVRTASNKKN
jgi:hypothetical protein